MAAIRVLPKELADMIAAGEVVERPASAVKELVENSVDAGASQITVEIRRGGAAYIRVTDNGSGIPKDEVATAFLRHATSKLRAPEDLERIGTLGFRGEALAAIAAVSRVQILTKPARQAVGYSYSIESSQPKEAGDAGCPDGTTVVVRDLFFSVPARYKYLKADAAEGAAIHAILEREALAHPEIAFRFLRDGKSVFATAGDGALRRVVDVLMPGEAKDLLEVSAPEGPIQVAGFVSRPTRCRGTRNGQFIFVNGRWIKSKLLTAAIERAYENQHMVGRFPVAVLHIEMALDKVDVNAHPAKTEVRFVEEKPLFGSVYRAVQSALDSAADRPQLRTVPAQPAPAGQNPAPPAAQSPAPAAFRGAAAQSPAAREPEEELVFRSPAAPPRGAVWPRREERWRVPAPPPRPEPEREPEQLRLSAPARERPEEAPGRAETAPRQEETPPWRVVGEALRTYIIVEQGDKLLFIDKHAAHERLGFDALKTQGCRPMSQELLRPLVWRPDPEERAVLLDKAGELEEFGFRLEELGEEDVVVRAAPDFLAYGDIAATLEELAEKYALGVADPESQRDGLLHTMACKAAMKGGQKNQAEELEVIARAVMEGRVTHCPHGRPVATELTKKQLEKQFGRLG